MSKELHKEYFQQQNAHNLDENPSSRKGSANQNICLSLESDMDCRLMINGQDQGQLDKNISRMFFLPAGSHLINAQTCDGLIEDEWVQALKNEDVSFFIKMAEAHGQAQSVFLGQRDELKGSIGIECWTITEIQQAAIAAAKEAGTTHIFRDGPDAPEMVVIPRGSFRMGEVSNKHKVTIAHSFAVSRYPVTVAEWRQFVASGGSTYSPADNGWPGDSLPVTNVNFVHAQAYVRWLSTRTGKNYRLLSEAEWEYACRAGSTTEYYWGDELGKNNCNCQDSKSEWSCRRASPVGSFSPNKFGLHDMLGNVWEWVEDAWHDTYNGAPTDGSAWLSDGAVSTLGNQEWRVLRGGSWMIDPRDARCAVRFMCDQLNRNAYTGIRVARTLS